MVQFSSKQALKLMGQQTAFMPPFALMYADVEMVKKDVRLRKEEVKALESAAAPIVLAPLLKTIAPGLDTLGVMLPCTPLLQLIEAHFGAVLAENHLLQTDEAVLGIIWDGAGYGEDGQVWGGEVFLLENDHRRRVAHLSTIFPSCLAIK